MSIDRTNPSPREHPLKTGISGKKEDLKELSEVEGQEKPLKELVDDALATGENETTKAALEKRREVRTA